MFPYLDRMLSRLLLFAALTAILASPGAAQRTSNLIDNGEFERGSSDGKGGGAPGWLPYEKGYDIDRQTFHHGAASIRCDSANTQSKRGAFERITLNQAHPTPIVVTGWSRADQVSGVKDSDYSLYIDADYSDGTPLWGLSASFQTGSHDWQRRQVLIVPTKPIKTMTVYALFRQHSGTAWFDDFHARSLEGNGLFDSQAQGELPRRTAAPAGVRATSADGLGLSISSQGDFTAVKSGAQDVSSQAAGGFWVRDVQGDTAPIAMRGAIHPYHGGAEFSCTPEALNLRFYAKVFPEGDSLSIDGELTDLSNTDRAVTAYCVLPIDAIGWNWANDIRHAIPIRAEGEYSNQTRLNAGATGSLSLYPFGVVSNSTNGIGYVSQMDWPSVFRIFYNGSTRQFVMAWDFALTGKTAAWPSHNARFRCRLFRLPTGEAAWGFRAAAQRFYKFNALSYARKAIVDGIWMPFTDPTKVDRYQDFGFAYHEGDNSLKSDDAAGILSFRYSEPMSYWLPMPPDMPRTYENAMGLITKNAAGADVSLNESTNMARAVLNSGTQDENGHYNLEFRNEPWANGAVFTLDPNPELAASPEKPTKASLTYTVALAMKMYGDEARKTRGEQDGEYLDSLEAWSDVQDYRPSNILACPYPIPFDTDSRSPVLPQWFSTYSFTRNLRDDLHNRGKLLMANSTPIRFSIFAPMLDVSGIEVNWLDGQGKFQPDSDEVFNLRRTLSDRKPYLLLMNTDYDRFTSPMVESYFQRSMFYGVFPSMFSANAANNPYWESPRWYNRDRPLFRKYIPIIKRLSAAGWEPITHARTSDPRIYVERWGRAMFTVLNSSAQAVEATLQIDRPSGNGSAFAGNVINLLSGGVTHGQSSGGMLSTTLHLGAGEAQTLEVK